MIRGDLFTHDLFYQIPLFLSGLKIDSEGTIPKQIKKLYNGWSRGSVLDGGGDGPGLARPPALPRGHVRRWGRWGVHQVGIFGAFIVVFCICCVLFVVRHWLV